MLKALRGAWKQQRDKLLKVMETIEKMVTYYKHQKKKKSIFNVTSSTLI